MSETRLNMKKNEFTSNTIINNVMKISFLLLAFTLIPLSVSSLITVKGDLASGDTIDLYVYEGTNGGETPCSGTGSSDSNVNRTGDVTYDDNDDYTLKFTPSGSPVDVNVC